MKQNILKQGKIILSTLYIGTKNNHSVHMFDTLFVGKRYKFCFTHRKECIGVVCDIDKAKQTFVVCDLSNNGYELVPVKRLLFCEGVV